MNVETHWITLISIIIGLGLAKVFGNLHRLVSNRTRVGWDVLPLAWATMLLFLVLNYWWALYLRLDGSQQARTAGEFGLILAPSLLLFFALATVLPEFGPDDDWDMRRQYGVDRKTLILTLALCQVSTFTTTLLVGSLARSLITVARFAILALLLSMLLTKSRRWDWIVVVAIMAFLLVRLNMQVVQ